MTAAKPDHANPQQRPAGTSPDDPRLAVEIERADSTAFHLGGRWKGRAVTTPQVARLEFYHPLPAELEALVAVARQICSKE